MKKNSLGASALLFLLLSTGCSSKEELPVRSLVIDQKTSWTIEPGQKAGDAEIVASLGTVSLWLHGQDVVAPFDGKLEINERNCLIYTSDEAPSYSWIACSLNPDQHLEINIGPIAAGDVIVSGKLDGVAIQTMTRLNNGKWSVVQTSAEMISRFLGSQLAGVSDEAT